MALCRPAVCEDTNYRLRFSFLSNVYVVSCPIWLICRLKTPHICFFFSISVSLLLFFLCLLVANTVIYLCDYSLFFKHCLRVFVLIHPRGCRRGVMVKAMDFGIKVREFELQSLYYVPSRTVSFLLLWSICLSSKTRTHTLGKCLNPLILPAMG